VDVVDRLATVGSGVDNGSVSLCKALCAGDFSCRPVQMPEQFFVFSLGVRDGSDMLSRDDEDVDWRLRFQVGERVTVVVLIDGFRRDAAVDDLAEDTAHSQKFIGVRALLSGLLRSLSFSNGIRAAKPHLKHAR
jgi:hypothetical protein